MPTSDPPLNTTSTAHDTVTSTKIASNMHLDSSTDNYPPVWATAQMIGLMEIASARILVPYLNAGELSAGVGVDILHLKPTPLGPKVWAEAKFVGKEGKLYAFEVKAFDAGGEVGRGRHTRGVMKEGRAEETARRRCGVKL